ncbi:MAG: nucleoside hydrolase [Candidatus Sulfotelmatobacter sp.]
MKFVALLCAVFLLLSSFALTQQNRYVVIDQDAMGPAGTDMNSILVFLQSPNVNVLGITVVTGDGWRNEEVAHTLRLLELVGRADVPVVPGIDRPMIRTKEWTNLWEQMHGKVIYQGAWNMPRSSHNPDEVPNLPEGNPTTKAASEDAAHFMVRMVHKYPRQVTIYAAGPMTNVAAAVISDPQFASLAQELVIMGGSVNPHTDDPEYLDSPRHEFNLWFDPEASSITLHAPWPKISVTTVDVSIETQLTAEMLSEIGNSHEPAAQYIAHYTSKPGNYLWDELTAAAWLDPSLITRERYVYMDVSLDKGISYGDTLVWTDNDKPSISLQKAHVQMDVDWPKFQKMFINLMSAPTPNSRNPQMAHQPMDESKHQN